MKAIALSICLVAALTARSEETPALSAPPTTETATNGPTSAADRKTIEHAGQTFELATSSARENVATDEYVLTGEKITQWSQLVTVQRLTLAKTTAADEFLAYFQKRLQAEEGSTAEVLKQSPKVSVFAVRFPKSERNDEQVMICLVLADPEQSNVLNIVQYALKPSRVPAQLAERQLRAWRDRFVAQATSPTNPSA